MAMTHRPTYGDLNRGQSEVHTVTLQAGTTYTFVGACDGDCRDLDLCIYDENNNRINCDQLADDKPIVRVTPRWSGLFRVKISMHNCSVNPCGYGLVVYGD